MTDFARKGQLSGTQEKPGFRKRFASRMSPVYAALNRRSGGWLDILRVSYTRYVTTGGAAVSASLAYYALFSLFPLILFLIVVVSFITESSAQAYDQAILMVRSAVPVSIDLIEKSITEALKLRGQISLISAIGLLWAASGFFETLITGINRAWNGLKLRGLVANRLIALGMVFALAVLLLLSLLTNLLIPAMPQWIILDGSPTTLSQITFWQVVLRILSSVFALTFFTTLYRWVPNKIVCWSAVLKGALLTTLAWEAARVAFTLYMGSGLVNYRAVFGSLGALAALMVWIYLSNSIILFGAHVVATFDQREEPGEHANPPEAH